MPRNENKENDVVVSLNDDTSFPQTPAHLLKRTRSTILKAPPLAGKQELNNISADSNGRDLSPLRKMYAQQGRLPLASKDNNRSKGTIFQQQQPTNTSLFMKDNKLQLKKHKQPYVDHQKKSEHGHVLASPRKLQKYGSVLGCSALPKMKSLVLKDVGKNDSDDEDNEGDFEDDDEEDNILRAKLQKAISRPAGVKEVYRDDEVEGLFNKSGIKQLIQEVLQKDDQEEESIEIEQGPTRYQPLPYLPNGYTPPSEKDIEKLKAFHSPYVLPEEEEGENGISVKDDGLLNLEDVSSIEELDTNDTEIFRAKDEGFRNITTVTSVSAMEPGYEGGGLDAHELNDLLSD